MSKGWLITRSVWGQLDGNPQWMQLKPRPLITAFSLSPPSNLSTRFGLRTLIYSQRKCPTRQLKKKFPSHVSLKPLGLGSLYYFLLDSSFFPLHALRERTVVGRLPACCFGPSGRAMHFNSPKKRIPRFAYKVLFSEV
jgi:hypothetical protein